MTTEQQTLYLSLYLVLYALAAIVWRWLLVWRRIGSNPVILKREDDTRGYIARIYPALVLCYIVMVGLWVLYPPSLAWMGRLDALVHPRVQAVGWGLLVLSLLGIVWAQAQMGLSWRIGIDPNHPAPLVRHGLFRYSRNPIYLCARVTLLGVFLVLPNAASLALLVATNIVIQAQVRLEEEFLLTQHGPAYQDYCQQVRRWV